MPRGMHEGSGVLCGSRLRVQCQDDDPSPGAIGTVRNPPKALGSVVLSSLSRQPERFAVEEDRYFSGTDNETHGIPAAERDKRHTPHDSYHFIGISLSAE
jgi:hypothetical protein